MAETYALSVQKREISKHSARECRRQACVPGVVYGHGFDPVTISVGNSDLLRTYRKAGKSSLINLDIDGKKTKVLIQTIQWHPVRGEMHHIDFFAVNLKEKTTVEVPLVFVGEVPAVRNFGGVFMRDHETISIRCLPTEIPHDIQVDISGLENLHDHLTIAALNLDMEKFELMGGMDPETVICSVTGRAEEEEEVVAEGEDGEEGVAEGDEGKSEDEGDSSGSGGK